VAGRVEVCAVGVLDEDPELLATPVVVEEAEFTEVWETGVPVVDSGGVPEDDPKFTVVWEIGVPVVDSGGVPEEEEDTE
jgi:hypothetical protein